MRDEQKKIIILFPFSRSKGECGFFFFFLKFIAYYVVFHAFLSSADFLQNKLFEKKKKNLFRNTIRMSNSLDPDSSGLIWAQTVCQGYQQTTLVDASERNDSSPVPIAQWFESGRFAPRPRHTKAIKFSLADARNKR